MIPKILNARDLPISEDIIFIDNSIHSTTSCCREKGRLSYVEHLRPIAERPPLVFGSAFHAGVARLRVAIATGVTNALDQAKLAFIQEVKNAGSGALPISADGDERRSVERGIYLLEAYFQKWAKSDLLWEDCLSPGGDPYVEVGFAVYFMSWHGRPVVYVGKIDRLRRYRVDGKIYVWELKTTSSSIKAYSEQTRPNHQFTGYKWAAAELLGVEVVGCILDMVFISDRKVDGKFPNGIDIEKDFGRVETRRSETDIKEFLYDLELFTTEFLTLQERNLRRWHRNAPAACYMYGGCHFRDACNSNLNTTIMLNKYKREPWEPWRGIIDPKAMEAK